MRNGISALLVVLSGTLFAFVSPHAEWPWLWPFTFPPLFLALALQLHSARGVRRIVWRTFLCSWITGMVMVAFSGSWIAHSAHVFGGLPLPLAWLVSAGGYGSWIGLELFLFLGLPFAWSWRAPVRMLWFLPLWATCGQLYLPRFLYFYTYGQLLSAHPTLTQSADLFGSGGLNLLFLPTQLLIYGAIRSIWVPQEIPKRAWLYASACVAALCLAAWGYGSLRIAQIDRAQSSEPMLDVVGMQPNFSLARLASNPALAPAGRELSLHTLLADSAIALESLAQQADRIQGVPPASWNNPPVRSPTRLLVWPESVFPYAYFEFPQLQERIGEFARRHQTHIVFSTWERRLRKQNSSAPIRSVPYSGTQRPYSQQPGQLVFHGTAVHIGADGTLQGRYRKIALFPYGEYVPLGDWLPIYRRLLLHYIPQISQFEPGREAVVFDLPHAPALAPLLCYDVTQRAIALDMVARGARLAVVQANLSWFGDTSIEAQFGWLTRFRAIETGTPFLLLAQGGPSWWIDPAGRPVSNKLPAFRAGVLSVRVSGAPGPSFYASYHRWIDAGYVLLLLLGLLFRSLLRKAR